MTSESTKGLHDPWRTGDPARDTKEAPVGTVGSTHPMDEDLRPETKYTLQLKGAGAITIRGALSAGGAVAVFLHTVNNWPELRQYLEAAGFILHVNKERSDGGFFMRSPDDKLQLTHPTCENTKQGFTILVRTLVSAARYDEDFRDHLRKFGIEPLLT